MSGENTEQIEWYLSGEDTGEDTGKLWGQNYRQIVKSKLQVKLIDIC